MYSVASGIQKSRSVCSKVFITGSHDIKLDRDISTFRATYKRIEENLWAQRYSSGDPPISKSTSIPEWEADSVSTRKKYCSHNEGNYDIDD